LRLNFRRKWQIEQGLIDHELGNGSLGGGQAINIPFANQTSAVT
jgi:hypothetical protein